MDRHKEGYIRLGELEIYQISVELSGLVWNVFEGQDWQIRKVVGDQFVRAVDSIGANIAEGYGRFHYKDKVKFFYYSRGSLLESKHWAFLHKERSLIKEEQYNEIINKLNQLHKKLNLYIKSYHNNLK